jgi:hypothetical protein
VKRLLEYPVAGQADVARALEGPRLRPLLQEDHLRAVDRVGLHFHMSRHQKAREV